MGVQHFKSRSQFCREPLGKPFGKDCFLYLILSGKLIKIGSTNSPRARIYEVFSTNVLARRWINGIYVVKLSEPRGDRKCSHVMERAIQGALRYFRYREGGSTHVEHFALPSDLQEMVVQWFRDECPINGVDAIAEVADAIEENRENIHQEQAA